MGNDHLKDYVYIMSNPAFPDLVKIGWTRKNPNERANQLSSTGTPMPFKVEDFIIVNDGAKIEKVIHVKLDSLRWNKDREFFCMSVEDARRVLKLFREDESKLTLAAELFEEGKSMLDNERYLLDVGQAIGLIDHSADLGYLPANKFLCSYYLDQKEPKKIYLAKKYALRLINEHDIYGYKFLSKMYLLIENFPDAQFEINQYIKYLSSNHDIYDFLMEIHEDIGYSTDYFERRDEEKIIFLTNIENMSINFLDISSIKTSSRFFSEAFKNIRRSPSATYAGAQKLQEYMKNIEEFDMLGAAAISYSLANLVKIREGDLIEFYRDKLYLCLLTIEIDQDKSSIDDLRVLTYSLIDYINCHNNNLNALDSKYNYKYHKLFSKEIDRSMPIIDHLLNTLEDNANPAHSSREKIKNADKILSYFLQHTVRSRKPIISQQNLDSLASITTKSIEVSLNGAIKIVDQTENFFKRLKNLKNKSKD